MKPKKGVIVGTLAFITLFTLIVTVISKQPVVLASGADLNPTAARIIPTSDPATVTVEATFKASPIARNHYLLDTEVFNGNKRVAQWFETAWVEGEQIITRSYSWTHSNSKGTTYTLKLGVFSPDWSNLYSWNDKAGQFKTAEVSMASDQSAVSFMRGINLAGAEFGETRLPGVYGQDYIYPDASELDYYHAKGFDLIRLPFRWERLQHTLFGDLDQDELNRLDQVVAAASDRNMKIILEPHNYARYQLNGVDSHIGSKEVPQAAFQDFWSKVAAHYQNENTVYAFGLMNEPHDTAGSWKASAQAGLNGIRQSDQNHLVLVPGDSWSSAWHWQQYNKNLLLNDPANNLMYEAHQYFDRDGSGRYAESYDASGAYPTIGADRIQPFLNWLKANGTRGIVTEYGVPGNDPRWQTVLDNFLAKLDEAGLSGTYWAGGPWWGDYPLSAEPVGGQDAPIMAVLLRHPGR